MRGSSFFPPRSTLKSTPSLSRWTTSTLLTSSLTSRRCFAAARRSAWCFCSLSSATRAAAPSATTSGDAAWYSSGSTHRAFTPKPPTKNTDEASTRQSWKSLRSRRASAKGCIKRKFASKTSRSASVASTRLAVPRRVTLDASSRPAPFKRTDTLSLSFRFFVCSASSLSSTTGPPRESRTYSAKDDHGQLGSSRFTVAKASPNLTPSSAVVRARSAALSSNFTSVSSFSSF
mmetsp:Transcript_6080/g.19837  ORF Transcript_6080/g.19837 Transcript_6080/m.19837 type:complete len:232 (-) Transcript_6080:276-971(-)